MRFEKGKLLSVAAFALLLVAVPAHAVILQVFTSRAAFNATSSNLTTITFEGFAPPSSVSFYQSPPGLTTQGVNFQSPTDRLFVFDPGFFFGLWNYNSGQVLQSNDFFNPSGIDVALPAGITALGSDVSAHSEGNSIFTATVSFSTGEVFNFLLPSRPTLSFLGFASSTPISLVQFATGGDANGIYGITMDNFTFGQTNIVTPEPTTLALLGIAMAGLRLCRRKRTTS